MNKNERNQLARMTTLANSDDLNSATLCGNLTDK